MKLKRTYKLFISLILLFFQAMGFAQTSESIIIKGTVSALSNKETLVGVSVLEETPDKRVVTNAITDINGQYVIKIKNKSNKLVFSYMGFKKKTVSIGPSSTINAELEDDTHELETVDIVGKNMQFDGTLAIPKREISGAMQKISTQEFEGVQVTSLDDAIQGRIAGLDIVSNSGDPGSGTTMKIRGASSINANTQPLIVINGVPFEAVIDQNFDFANANQEQYASMLSISPEDILDITVLKDASSTAQWGSKGANGVLSITTKKGAKGNVAISYKYMFTRKVQPRGRNLLNGDDFTMMMKQALFNPFQNENAASVREYSYDKTFSEYENYNNNTDWYSEVTRTGFAHDHYLAASGGGERASYRVSASYLTDKGTIIGSQLQRYSTRAYLDYSVSERLKFISEFSFTYTDNDKNYINNTDNKMSILDIAYNKMPNLSVYDQDLSGVENRDLYYNILISSGLSSNQKYLKNPVALALEATNNSRNYRIIPTFRIQYDILDPAKQSLRYQMYVSFDVDNTTNSLLLSKKAMNLSIGDGQVNRVENSDGLNLTIQTDNNITWVPKFTNVNHNLLVMASFQLRTGRSNPFGVISSNLPSTEITDATSNGILSGLYSTPGEWRSVGFLTRAHYVYKSRYILDLTIRRDGSTKFGEGQKFGNFPGISAKWIITDEPFMKSTQNWLSMLAIRPSWGISGRQPDSENLYQSRVRPVGDYMDMGATVPSNIPLVHLKWEKAMAYNLGMDISFFNEKLIFDLNGYLTKTSDILFKDVKVSDVSGYSVLPWVNLGEMENIGWEVIFNSNRLIKHKDFTMDFQFNLANNKNTLVSLGELVMNNFNQPYGYNNGEYLGRIQEGNAWGSIYGFRYKGVYRYNDYIPGEQEDAPVARDVNGRVLTDYYGNPLPMKFAYGRTNEYTFKGGDAKYEDINHDGSIDNLDIVYLGNSNPKLTGGFGSSIRYKGFAVTAFFNFRWGNKIINYARMLSENMYYDNNQSVAVNYRWRKDGDITDIPRALYNYGYNWLGSDRYLEDGSFIRFKYLTFRYNPSTELVKKLSLKTLNFYLTINNIAVLTEYTGVDPEVGYGGLGDNGMCFDRSKTPRSKDFTLGITVGF